MAKTKWPVNKIDRNSEALSKEFPDYEVVRHVQFNQTSLGKNANKFFSMEMHKASNGAHRVYTHYGRVTDGVYDHGAFEIRGPGDKEEMQNVFERLIKDKTIRPDPYVEIDFVKAKVGSPKARTIVKQVDASTVVKKLAPAVKSTIALDSEVARIIEQIYDDSSTTLKSYIKVEITKDGFETPLGILSPGQIEAGRKVLLTLRDAIAKNNSKTLADLSSQYYSLIPHKFGYKLTDENLIKTDSDLQKESDILQLMSDSLSLGGAVYNDTTSEKYRELGIEMNRLGSDTSEYQNIVKYISSTISVHHSDIKGVKIKNIFSLLLPHDRQRYDACPIGNKAQLFHGSRNSNIVGLLKRGMMIAPPEAPVSGYMFDKGAYFADQSSKSLNYSLKAFSTRSRNDSCYLFVFDVKLGKTLELENSDYSARTTCGQRGCNSVKGVVGRNLLHNEYIVYDTNQCTTTHLVELERPKGY